MTAQPQAPFHSERYTQALTLAAHLHRHQCRKGKTVPYIAHLIAVSALVWEDAGTEDQAIAALLHDAIEDAGQSEESIARLFGAEVGASVQACTDTAGPALHDERKEPWIDRKTRYIEQLPHKPAAALLVTAADKAHNARDCVLDAAADPEAWNRFRAGLAGTAWYFHSLHQQLAQLLPQSRSVAMLGEAVTTILESTELQALVPAGQTARQWVEGYLERPDSHPAD
nr:HD domain-containing protein [Cyanobium sp. NIES-981]